MMDAAWSKENKLHLIDRLLKEKNATLFGVIQRVAESPGGIERMRALLSGGPTDLCTDRIGRRSAKPDHDAMAGLGGKA